MISHRHLVFGTIVVLLLSAGISLRAAAPAGKTVLRIAPANPDLVPGESRQFTLVEMPREMPWSPSTEVKAVWTVEPRDASIVIDPATGEVRVTAKAVPGSRYVIKAHPAGRKIAIQTILVIYDPANIFVGRWTQTAEVGCDGRTRVVPDDLMRELVFNGRGEFNATWHPFELYRDYWGTYRIDLKARTIAIHIDGGNYVPRGIVSEGTFVTNRSPGQMTVTFHGLWFGRPKGSHGEAGCGMVFTRRID